MGPLILAALAGGLILLFIGTTIFYRSCVIDAENKRDEAISMSARALEAKQVAEEGFAKAKTFFDERNKIPLLALMTEEQMDKLAGVLAERLFMSNVRTTEIKQ